jgi:hypothetical protein
MEGTPEMSRIVLLAAGLAALAFAAAGCGRQAHLEPPRPLASHESGDRLTRDQAAARARADAAPVSPPRPPQSFDEVRNQGISPNQPLDQGTPTPPEDQAGSATKPQDAPSAPDAP